MVAEKFIQELTTKGFEHFKGWSQALSDISGTVLKAMERGRKSPFHVSTESFDFGHYRQVFKTKEGNVIQKMYNLQKGTIETALFKGDKVIRVQDPTLASITQPDMLVTQKWHKSPIPNFNWFESAVTKPTQQTMSLSIEGTAHKPQITERLKVGKTNGVYEVYPSKMESGRWWGYGSSIGGPMEI